MIMNYEEKYKEALERAKNWYADAQIDFKKSLETLFPELAEPEDEKVRKALKQYFVNSFKNNGVAAICGVHVKDVLAWLEKQGDYANFRDKAQVGDRITKNEDGVLVNLSQLKRVAKPSEKQGEQKFEMKTAEESLGIDSATYNKIVDECIFGEQKPEENKGNIGGISSNSEWGEEDSPYYDDICEILINFLHSEKAKVNKEAIQKDLDWITSVKKRMEMKQEWSEEDINMIDWLIRCCEEEHEELCNDKYGHQDIVSDLKRDCRKKWDWLESLKNRVAPLITWKPSDEQIRCLKEVVSHRNLCGLSETALNELLSDLKKLKEGKV